jgi:hypothetical protein
LASYFDQTLVPAAVVAHAATGNESWRFKNRA